MNKKIYSRGIAGQCWYNFTEALVYGLTYKPTPDGLIYNKEIKYGDGDLQYINVYTHRENTKKRPLLIYIHGGSWISGITEMRNAYIAEWAKKGFNTAAISYSYAPQKIFPTQLQEIFSAIDFIYDNADKYSFDMDNIVLAGESAGGYFVSYVASVIADSSSIDELGIEFRHRNNITIKGIFTISGCYSLSRISDKSKPQSKFPDLKTMITSYLGTDISNAIKMLNSEKRYLYSPQVNSSYPPSFIIWADKDLIRYESFDFSEELRSNNVRFKLYKADGIIGMHAWPIVMLFNKSKTCLQATFDFILPHLHEYFFKNDNDEWMFNN